MFIKLKNLSPKINPFFIFLLIFFITISVISPWGNYAVNDDWQFYTHVRYFLEGDFRKNPLIDAAFILQGFIGLFWVKIWGLTFVNLKILTILFSIIFFYGVYRILLFFNINKKLILLTLSCILIEPFILTSSLSFMTEIYFLTFMIWSLFFFLKFTDNKDKFQYVFLATSLLLAGFSLLIRQFGVVLGITYLIYFFIYIKDKKTKILLSLITLFTSLLFVYINLSFPQNLGNYNSKSEKITSLLSNAGDYFYKFILILKYIPYVILFLSPLLINLKTRLSIQKKFLFLIPVMLILYSIDIFDLKNIFHLECLYCETNFTSEFSLTDNQYTKILVSGFFGFILVNTIFYIRENKKNILLREVLKNKSLFTTITMALGMILVILVVDSFYDRYFINFDILLLIITSYALNSQKINYKVSFLVFFFTYLIVLFLNIEFYNSIYYKWSQGNSLLKMTNYQMNSQIYVSGAFARLQNAYEKDRDELFFPVKTGEQKCFVVRHVENSKNAYLYKNPSFSNKSNNVKLPKLKDNKNNVVIKNEYFSPIFNLLGQNVYIVSICKQEVIDKYNLQRDTIN